MNEGIKFDQGKSAMHLLPPELLFGVGEVLEFGAQKYNDRNWELGMDWSRPFGSLMRHMWAWWRGEDKDPETGMSHLWHAGCNIAFLIAYEERKVGKDDRPISTQLYRNYNVYFNDNLIIEGPITVGDYPEPVITTQLKLDLE